MAGTLTRCWVIEDAIGGKYYVDFLFDAVMSISTAVASSIVVSPDNGSTEYTVSTASMISTANNRYLRIEVDSTFRDAVFAEGDADKSTLEVKLTAGAFKDNAENNCSAIAYTDNIRCHVISTAFSTMQSYEVADADGKIDYYLPKNITVDFYDVLVNNGITVNGYGESTILSNFEAVTINATKDYTDNFDFEAWTGATLDDWTNAGSYSGVSKNTTTTYIKGGSASAKLTGTGAGADIFKSDKAFTFDETKKYTCRLFASGINFTAVSIQLYNSSSPATQTLYTFVTPSNIASGYYCFEFQPDASGYDTFQISATYINSNSVLYLDDIRIYKEATQADNIYLYCKNATIDSNITGENTINKWWFLADDNIYSRFENCRLLKPISAEENFLFGSKYIVLDRCWHQSNSSFLPSTKSEVYNRLINCFINGAITSASGNTVLSYCNSKSATTASSEVDVYNSYILNTSNTEIDNTNDSGLPGITLAESQTGTNYTSGGLLKVGRQFRDFETEMLTGVPTGDICPIGAFQNAVTQQLTVSTAVLGGDNRTVTLTLSSAMTSGDIYSVTVNNVESTSGDVIERGTTKYIVAG